MPANKLLERFQLEHPIIQAPMGGGPTTPALVAAVCNAGALGSLAAAYLTPEQIAADIRAIRRLTDKPFNVNLFAGGWDAHASPVDPAPMLSLLADIHATLDLPPPSAPEPTPDPFPAQFEAVLQAHPSVFSFTFGIPSPEAISQLRSAGIYTIGTATTVEEARLIEEAGVDAVVAQGTESGAHRGTFAGTFESSMIPTYELVRTMVSDVSIPVIASGGIMDGREIAKALSLGASAAQLGTAFLACPESGATDAYKQALLAARGDETVITRAFSGRPARGIPNEFISKVAQKEEAILPYPLQNALTRSMRTAAGKRGDARFLSLWAGTGVARIRAMPAAELVRLLADEMRAAEQSTAAD